SARSTFSPRWCRNGRGRGSICKRRVPLFTKPCCASKQNPVPRRYSRGIGRQKVESFERKSLMPVKPIPDGYHSVTPYLIVDDATRALDFYQKAFGAVELVRMPAPGGKIGHAEIRIGDSVVMFADESPQMNARSARSFGGSPMFLMIYVQDVDAFV